MSNAPMPPMPPMPGMIGGQQPPHPSLEVFKKYVNGAVSRDEAINAFCEYIMTGIRGMPIPNPELAKSVLSSDSSATFMGYPQIIQCVALMLKQS